MFGSIRMHQERQCPHSREVRVGICSHAGGVGLCEAVQHLSMFDYVAVSGSMEGRMIEYVDHLHEHFAVPVDVRAARYSPPMEPGAGYEMLEASVAEYTFPRVLQPVAP